MIDIAPTTDTAFVGASGLISLGALITTVWREWKLAQKFNTIKEQFNDVRVQLKGHDDEIEAHAVYDAGTYVSRDELANLRQHIDNKLDKVTDKFDAKFDNLNTTIISLIQDGKTN